jgi:hypothetical protein
VKIPNVPRRIWIGLGVTSIVVVTLGVARMSGGAHQGNAGAPVAQPAPVRVTATTEAPPGAPSAPAVTSTDAPTTAPPPAAEDGVVAPTRDAPKVNAPVSSPIIAAASGFAHAWLNVGVGTDAWRAGMSPFTTTRLQQALHDAEPSVPATQVTGTITTPTVAERYAIASVPLDNGLLSLRLVIIDQSWLVDSIDWQRS